MRYKFIKAHNQKKKLSVMILFGNQELKFFNLFLNYCTFKEKLPNTLFSKYLILFKKIKNSKN